MPEVKDLDYYVTLSQRMVDEDRDRDIAIRAYDDIYHNLYHLPESMKVLQWVRKVIDTDPHDAVRTVVRTLASRPPRIKVLPMAPTSENKKRAQEIEYILKWCLRDANRRRRTTIERDMAKSAVLYDEVIANVIDIDYQIDAMKSRGVDTARMEAAKAYGDYVVNVFYPGQVHVRYSNLMPECVVVCKMLTLYQIRAEYGIEIEGKDDDKREVRDYWDYRVHATWVHDQAKEKEKVILAPTEHGLGFLPFSCSVGGDTLEENSMHQRQGILYPIYTSGVWETTNVVKTLMVSEAVAHAAAPRLKEEGPMPESTTEVDYGDPGLTAKVTPGNVLTQMSPPELDAALSQIAQLFALQMGQDTVSKILQGNVPENTAFAAQNLGILTALGQVRPYMMLVERALSDLFTLKLRWSRFTGKPVYARGLGRTNAGVQYSLPADEIDPDNLVIDVELDPDLPLDKMARVNAATMAKSLGMSNETALEQMGVEDPASEVKQWYRERYQEHKFNLRLQAEQAELEAAIQERMMAMQADAQAAAEEEAMSREAAMQEAFAAQGGMGVPGAEGPGFNPAAGGTPPALVDPTATMEGSSGRDRMGNPLGGV